MHDVKDILKANNIDVDHIDNCTNVKVFSCYVFQYLKKLIERILFQF